MPKYNSIQRYKTRIEQQFNFSFSQPKNKQIFKDNIPIQIQSCQKRSIGMWINTVLQLHSEQFLHALKYSRKVSMYYLNQYIVKYYSHVKDIIRFYVIAALLDYDFFTGINCEEKSLGQQCIFLNIIIEELSNRFFRESQWLHKISHLPSYLIFSIFDPYLKGYTTVQQIKKITQSELIQVKFKGHKISTQKKESKLKRLLHKKLSNNLEQKDPRIYQQNIEELMLRVNLIIFEDILKTKKLEEGSKIYRLVRTIIAHEDQKSTVKKDKCQIKELQMSQKAYQQLRVMNQDIQIKQMSNIMSRRQYSSQMYPQTQRKQWRSTEYEKTFLSTPSIPVPSRSHIKNVPAQSSPLQSPFSQHKLNEETNIVQNQSTKTKENVMNESQRQKMFSDRRKSALTTKQKQLKRQESEQIPLSQKFETVKEDTKQNNILMEKNISQDELFNAIPQIKGKNSSSETKRSKILQQLQSIRIAKRKAHIHFLQYI